MLIRRLKLLTFGAVLIGAGITVALPQNHNIAQSAEVDASASDTTASVPTLDVQLWQRLKAETETEFAFPAERNVAEPMLQDLAFRTGLVIEPTWETFFQADDKDSEVRVYSLGLIQAVSERQSLHYQIARLPYDGKQVTEKLILRQYLVERTAKSQKVYTSNLTPAHPLIKDIKQLELPYEETKAWLEREVLKGVSVWHPLKKGISFKKQTLQVNQLIRQHLGGQPKIRLNMPLVDDQKLLLDFDHEYTIEGLNLALRLIGGEIQDQWGTTSASSYSLQLDEHLEPYSSDLSEAINQKIGAGEADGPSSALTMSTMIESIEEEWKDWSLTLYVNIPAYRRK